MHFAIAPEHLEFFYRHHYIEFDDLLTETEADQLKKAIGETLEKRLNFSPDKLMQADVETLFMAGHDTWRDDDRIKKVVLRPRLAEIAASLMKKRQLRIAYDQVFGTPNSPLDPEKLKSMPPLFHKHTSLGQTSSFQSVVCGLMLHLSSSSIPTQQSNLSIEEDLTSLIPLPRKAGSGIFFTPDIPLSLEYLFETPNQHQLLIVYCEDKSLYRHEKSDPHTHALKKLGYVFGDRLKNTTHPVVYRD